MIAADSLHDLKTLIRSFHSIVAIDTLEEERAAELLHAAAAELGLPVFEWTLTRGLRRLPGEPDDRAGWTTDPLQLLAHIETLQVDALFHLKDFAVHLDGPAVVRQLRDLAQRFATRRSTLILTGHRGELPSELAHWTVPFELRLPTAAELRPVLRQVARSLSETAHVRVDLDDAGTDALLAALSGLTVSQARQTVARAALDDGRLDAGDVAVVLERKAEVLRGEGLLDYFPAEQNAAELGGFASLKAWLDRARVGFGEEARALGLSPPRGLLLVGVQGCGKSLAAKCIARRWGLPLLKLDAGRLYDKYVGETEKNFRRVTKLAETMAPLVLWIDELEKAFGPGASGELDGGVGRRVFGAFLTWLQEKRASVFVVATANDISALPPELIRKGRFDEIFFVDLPDPAERREIFAIHLRARRQDPDGLDLDSLVDASEAMAGAEIEQAVIASLYESLYRRAPLSRETLLQELDATVPLSVSRREEISALREMARDRFVPVR